MTSLAECCLKVIHHTSHSRVAGLKDSKESRKVSRKCMPPTCLNMTPLTCFYFIFFISFEEPTLQLTVISIYPMYLNQIFVASAL